jgi:hypothetical protein
MKYPFLISILISLNSCSQEKNCTDFKIGEFKYVDKNLPELITRTETTQIETNLETGIIIESSIKWTSECSYILTYEKIRNYQEDVSYMIGQKIYVDILETNGNRIKVHAKSKRINHYVEFIKTD